MVKDGVGLGPPTSIDGLEVTLLGIVALLVLGPVAVLTVVVGVEVLLVLLLLPLAALARVRSGRRWRVTVRWQGSQIWEKEAGTWAQSRALMEQIVADIERGDTDLKHLKKYVRPSAGRGADGADAAEHGQRGVSGPGRAPPPGSR